MCSYVVEELLDALASLFGWFGLLARDFVECKENGDVNRSRVVQEASNDLLYVFLAVLVESFTCVGWYWILSFGAVFDGGRRVGAVLCAFWFVMFVFNQLFWDVVWHGAIHPSFIVVPIKGDSAV